MATNLGKTRRDHDLWDKAINSKWADQKPILSPEESLLAAKKLYRHAMGKAWPKKWALTSGNRYTWPSRGVFYVNPERKRYGRYPVQNCGLRDIIHLISHWCHRRLHPADKPHSIRQLRLETKLTKFAIDRHWHEGTLARQPIAEPEKVAPAKSDVVKQRYAKLVSRRDKWAKELERAKRLHKKAESEARAYERRHGERVKPA